MTVDNLLVIRVKILKNYIFTQLVSIFKGFQNKSTTNQPFGC